MIDLCSLVHTLVGTEYNILIILTLTDSAASEDVDRVVNSEKDYPLDLLSVINKHMPQIMISEMKMRGIRIYVNYLISNFLVSRVTPNVFRGQLLFTRIRLFMRVKACKSHANYIAL